MSQVTTTIKVGLGVIIGVLVGLAIGGSLHTSPARTLRLGSSFAEEGVMDDHPSTPEEPVVTEVDTRIIPPLAPPIPGSKLAVGNCNYALLRGRQVNADITVYLPNFMNEQLLISNMRLMVRRSLAPHLVQYAVITMEDELPAGLVRRVQAAVPGVHIFHLPQPNKSGGSALPAFFRSVLEHSFTKITVTADTDALVLVDGWDERLRELFEDEELAVAAINPRTRARKTKPDSAHTGEFTGSAEWNWMAWRTAAFQGDFWVYEGDALHGAYDWGHLFTLHAQKQGLKQHLWNVATKFPYKAAVVSGDDKDPLWVLHTFYASRRHKELAVGSQEGSLKGEQRSLPRDNDLDRVVEWCGSNDGTMPPSDWLDEPSGSQ